MSTKEAISSCSQERENYYQVCLTLILNVWLEISLGSPASSSSTHHEVLNLSFGKYHKPSLHYALHTNHVHLFSNCSLLLTQICII